MTTLALDLASDHILVNAITPRCVMTEMTKRNLSQEEIETIANKTPTGRF